MPSPPPHTPDTLHLLRLAQTLPEQAIALPNTNSRVLWLTRQQPLPRVTSVLCLQGEVILDFADGGFTQLREHELCSVPEQASAVPVQVAALVLLLGERV